MREFQPDYTNMVKAARNIEVKRFPLYEHKVDPKVMEEITGVSFAELYNGDDRDLDEFFRNYCGFYRDMGYDTVSFEELIGPAMPGSGALGEHVKGVIQTREDFERYPWDGICDTYFQMYHRSFEALRRNMPEGMKAIGGVGYGIFECVQDLVGYEDLCYMRVDDEELYHDMFFKIGESNLKIWKRFLREYGDIYCVCRFGDDLGFKSTTLLPPDEIRELVIPQYKPIIQAVHDAGKPFLLHSCGCIFDVMEDIIAAASTPSTPTRIRSPPSPIGWSSTATASATSAASTPTPCAGWIPTPCSTTSRRWSASPWATRLRLRLRQLHPRLCAR